MALIPLSPQTFAGQFWRPMPNSGFARTVSLVELNASELPLAACHLPLAFIRQDDASYGVHALLGIHPGKNLFVAANGTWLGGYWPLRLRLAPFATALADTGEQVMCIQDEWWQDRSGEGFPFYAEDACTLSSQTAGVLQDCQAVLAGHEHSAAVCRALDAAGLIKPWELVLVVDQARVQVEGLFCIDEEAINALPAEALSDLRSNNALALAYCQLISMQHVQKLSELAHAHAQLDKSTTDGSGILSLGAVENDGTLVFSNL